MEKDNLFKYKMAALIGIILMGIGSFMACLGTASAVLITGNVLLVISLIVMIYAFTTWQP